MIQKAVLLHDHKNNKFSDDLVHRHGILRSTHIAETPNDVNGVIVTPEEVFVYGNAKFYRSEGPFPPVERPPFERIQRRNAEKMKPIPLTPKPLTPDEAVGATLEFVISHYKNCLLEPYKTNTDELPNWDWYETECRLSLISVLEFITPECRDLIVKAQDQHRRDLREVYFRYKTLNSNTNLPPLKRKMNIILENRFETMTKRLKHVKKPYSEDNLEGESAYDSDSEPEYEKKRSKR